MLFIFRRSKFQQTSDVDRETRKKLADMFQKVEKWQEVEKILQESRDHVLFDEEKFVPKPMKLARINLSKYRESHQSFQDRNVLVRYTNAELSAPIKFLEHAEFNVVNEWENIKDELKGF